MKTHVFIRANEKQEEEEKTGWHFCGILPHFPWEPLQVGALLACLGWDAQVLEHRGLVKYSCSGAVKMCTKLHKYIATVLWAHIEKSPA